MHKPPPCGKDCPNRSAEYHATCEVFIAWAERRKKIKSKINKQKALERIIAKGN